MSTHDDRTNHALIRPAPRRDPWPAEAVAILRAGVAAGDLDDVIATRITAETGRFVSRDSTLQKRLALGLYREHGPRVAPMPASTVGQLGVRYGRCQWVIGEVVRRGASAMCGCRTLPGKPWCAAHDALVFERGAA